jgi:hypothetical protein
MRVSLERIPAGAAGTDVTVKTMQKLIRSSLEQQSLRLRALDILRSFGVDSHAPDAAARALFYWVRSNIRYVNDPVGIETVQAPEITLRLKAGDCDDHATLVAALAMSIGIPARIVVIGSDPSHFEHVFAELNTDGDWHTADTTRPVAYGTPAPVLGARKIFEFSESEGLGMATPVLDVDAGQLEAAIRNKVLEGLSDRWRDGIIDRSDLVSYLRVIDEGNQLFQRDPWLRTVTRKLVADFLEYVDSNHLVSAKKASGLSGLNGLLSYVTSAVQWVVKTLFSGQTYQGATIVLPSVQNQPTSITQTVSDFFEANTGLVLVGGALLVYLIMRRK